MFSPGDISHDYLPIHVAREEETHIDLLDLVQQTQNWSIRCFLAQALLHDMTSLNDLAFLDALGLSHLTWLLYCALLS